MADFKKKIMDILFDDVSDDPAEEVLVTPKKEEKKSTVKAADILYGNKEAETSIMDFLNSNDTTEYKKDNLNKKTEVKKETYSYIENVSPIFGNINKPEQNVTPVNKKEEPKEEPKYYGFGDFTGVVISPIFGFDSVKANEARKAMDFTSDDLKVEKKEKEKEIEEIPYYEKTAQENLFNIPVQTKKNKETKTENEIVFANRGHEDTQEISFGSSLEDKSTSDEDLLDDTYDFNDLESDSDKDLFDELIGDND